LLTDTLVAVESLMLSVVLVVEELVAEFTLLDAGLLDSELLESVALSASKRYVMVGLPSVSVVSVALLKV